MGVADGTIVLLHWSIKMLFSFLQSESGAKAFCQLLGEHKITILSILIQFVRS